ncbi:hypothetical protein MMC17_004330 [Xylographa soralifera]|nr:hypothetical protein [Xylographa soralifera]
MTTKAYRFLTAAQVKRLYVTYVTNAQPTQPALLDSAVGSPINIKYYEQQQDLFQLAASLTEKIVKNHAFQDGNKRVALAAAEMFLRMNGWRLQGIILADDPMRPGLVDALVKVATGKWTAKQLGDYYKGITAQQAPSDAAIQLYSNGATTS